MQPSEYFDRNCGIGSSNTRRRELARRYEIGVGNIMWGNDFPHPEGTWPYTKRILARGVLGHPRRRDRAASSGSTRPSSTASTSTRCSRSPTRSGRRPRTSGRPTTSAFAKWDDLRAAGRHWLTGREAVPVAPTCLSESMALEGKVALVTGAGAGIGRGIALALAKAGRRHRGARARRRHRRAHRRRDRGARRATRSRSSATSASAPTARRSSRRRSSGSVASTCW